MAVIKSLEKIYFLKNVGIPEYYLGGNVEFIGLHYATDWPEVPRVVSVRRSINCKIKVNY